MAVVTNLSEVLKQELKKASNIFFIAQHETPSGRNQVLARLPKSAASGNPLTDASNSRTSTLGTRGFCRVRRELSLLAEGRHIFGRRPKPREKNRKTALESLWHPGYHTSQCHGVCKDQSSFRHILEYFFPRKWILPSQCGHHLTVQLSGLYLLLSGL